MVPHLCTTSAIKLQVQEVAVIIHLTNVELLGVLVAYLIN